MEMIINHHVQWTTFLHPFFLQAFHIKMELDLEDENSQNEKEDEISNKKKNKSMPIHIPLQSQILTLLMISKCRKDSNVWSIRFCMKGVVMKIIQYLSQSVFT